MPRPLRLLVVLAFLVPPLFGQDSVPPVTTTRAATTEWLRNLPIDFLEGFFILEPGVGPETGGYAVRGAAPSSYATYVDGMPVDAGYRGGAAAQLGASGSRLTLPATSVHSAAMTTGVLGIGFGGAQSGVLSLGTTRGVGKVSAGLDYATQAINGPAAGTGLNRLEGLVSGGIGTRFGFSVGGLVTGQPSVAYGPGQADVPIYLASGTDTVVAVPSAPGDPVTDTTFVPISSFEANDGMRIPASASSNYQLVGRLDYALSGSTAAAFTAAGSQAQARRFDYLNLYNPVQLGAERAASYAYTLSVTHRFGDAATLNRSLEVALSAQGDEFESGPLAPGAEADSRDPAGGFMVAPLDFRFGLDDFPIDEELVANVRLNKVGSRRSPYDLENTAQYSLVDRFRNNAYGLLGFTEGGGPVGRLALMDEDRIVGRVTLDWALDGRHTLRGGGEFVGYDLKNYSHSLTSQALSDVYIEEPSRQALFVEDRLTLGAVVVELGVRYDQFRTGAERVDGAPRLTSNPGYNPADPASLDSLMTPDETHGAWSPRLRAGYQVSPSTSLWLGVGRQVQMPDFGLALAGINTDLSVTTSTQVYGSDMDYASTTLMEFGATHRFGPSSTLDAVVYGKQLSGQPVVRPVTEYDPLRLQDFTILRYVDEGEGTVFGAELRLDQRVGPYFKAFVGYSYVNATVSSGVPAGWARPNTVAGAFGGTLPGGWKSGSLLGSILQQGGAWATLRVASGTAYTACAPETGSEGVLSGQPCTRPDGDFNGARLPTTKQFDLKLARGFEVGRTTVTGYLDIRNLFNAENTSAVYAVTGTTDSPVLESQTWSSDSAGYALEAQANGVESGGGMNLQFGGAGAGGCGSWVTRDGRANAANCVYLVRAEQRFGNGDGVFDLAEQRRASTAFYQAMHGSQLLTGPGRLIRLGITLDF